MDSDKIILTKELFWVLSSDTRITILKKLARQRMTISELSRELKIAKSTVHEHLALMTGAGLIVSVPDERDWKYYEITRNGANLLAPENSIPISILSTTIDSFFWPDPLLHLSSPWFSMKQPPI
jgi:DNA-binding transcriptional ArsR family regulator